jgi:hypothetical protein
VLSVSPVLMESYLAAARKISRSAIGDRSEGPIAVNYELPRFLMQNDRMSEDLPLGTRGGVAVPTISSRRRIYAAHQAAEERLHLHARHGACSAQLDVRVDGQKIKHSSSAAITRASVPLQPSSFGQGEYERYLINADNNLELRVARSKREPIWCK